MPKKSATTRSAAQRNRPKVQKSFEVVRQTAVEQQPADDEQAEEVVEVKSTPTPVKEVRASKSATKTATRVAVATPEVETIEESDTALAPAPEENGKVAPAPKGSASARLAARRSQKAQRSGATLITAEHYGYVTRDLIIIAVLASIMFIAIIVLYFTIGRGA
jgi:hypothetical protein